MVSVLPGMPEPPTVRAFRQGMRDLGYVEGKNLILMTRYAEGNAERLPALFAELIGQKADLLVTGSVVGTLAAKKSTTSVPIVFAGVLDPTSAGIVGSLSRPEGNITGTSYGVADAAIAEKWVELLKAVAPTVSRVAVLLNSADPQSPQLLRGVHSAARTLKITVSEFDAATSTALDEALAAIAASRAQGIIVTNSAVFGGNYSKLIRFAAEKRLPAIYFFNLFPDSGGLMSYGGSLEESYRRAATYADRILKGAKPGDLPIEQATKFDLVINLRTAKAIGLTIPESVLVRADRVIR